MAALETLALQAAAAGAALTLHAAAADPALRLQEAATALARPAAPFRCPLARWAAD